MILSLLLFLRDKFIKLYERLWNTIYWNVIYKRLSGTRLFRRIALKRYAQTSEKQYSKIPVPFIKDRPLILKDVYVPLRVAGSLTGAKIDSMEAVNQYPRLMVTGAPGSGKSTILKHFLLSCISGKLSRLPNHPVPILLELNRMNTSDKTLREELIDVLSRNNFPNGENFVQYGLEQGTLVLLLDGLDEVSSQKRSKVVQKIKDLSYQYSKCPLIVTCRTAVYNGELNDIVGHTLEVAEFDDMQILQFMSSWEKDMPPDKSVNQLIGTLHDRPRIMELARNPLMLTIIAYLYCDTPHELPHSRAEFYHISTDVLLRLWHQEYNKFRPQDKQSILKHLALFNQDNAQQRNRRTIDYETIMKEIRKKLPDINLPDGDAEPLLNEIVERSGLMISINGGVEYQFAHLTLQEYFAARKLEEDQEGLIRRYLEDPDSWREPVKLWCGLGHNSTRLIHTIYDKDPIMAFECLADAVEVDEELADTILHEFKDRLKKHKVPESVQKAFGAVASNINSLRGQDVFKFLANIIEKELIPRELTESELKEEREIETEAKQKVNKAVERLESPEEDASQYLKSMDKRVQFDFVTRILSGRKPTQNDWSNVLRKDVYEFDTSWHYYLILVIGGILSIISLGYMGWDIYYPQTLLSYRNLFFGILSFTILYDWYIFLTASGSADYPWLYFPHEFCYYFILGVFKVPYEIIEDIYLNRFGFEHLGLLPFMAWAPVIGYFTTIFMLNFVSWLIVAGIWVMIIVGCVSLAVIGSRKEARSGNPLRGILDVAEKLLSLK